MKDIVKIISIVLLIVFISCKKEDICDDCEEKPLDGIQNIEGNWKLVEYEKEYTYSYTTSIFNNVNNDNESRTENTYETKFLGGDTLYLEKLDSIIENKYFTYFNNETNSFKDSLYINKSKIRTYKKHSIFSYNVEITNNKWTTTKNDSPIYVYDFSTGGLYEDSLSLPTGKLVREGSLLWDGNKINAGYYMKGNIKSISDTEIIIEEISFDNDRKDSFSRNFFLKTYSEPSNPELTIEGILTETYLLQDYTITYSKWQKY